VQIIFSSNESLCYELGALRCLNRRWHFQIQQYLLAESAMSGTVRNQKIFPV